MIPFIDLKSQYAQIKSALEPAMLKVLDDGRYIMGPEVAQLEQRLADYVGTKNAVSCASGTDALVIALRAKGVGAGDAVFTTPFTFMASAEAVALVGATPVFIDVESSSFNIDPKKLRTAVEAAASSKSTHQTPRAIIGVDLFGLPADYEALNSIATTHGLFVIEDAAQSFGATRNGRRAGKLAEIACTSFFPAKPLGCYGDGGALFTDDDEQAALFKSIRVHGQGADRYEHVRIGLTSRLDTIQAAVLLAKLDIFDGELVARQAIAARYGALIAEADLPLITPTIAEGSTSAWAQYSLLAEDGDARAIFLGRLADAQIPSMIYYPKPLHLQSAFADLGYRAGDFPVAESLAERIFSLPMHPYLDDVQLRAIVSALVQ